MQNFTYFSRSWTSVYVGSVILLSFVVCCSSYKWEMDGPPPQSINRTSLILEKYPGLSGLTLAPDGTFWAVPERQPTLVPLSFDKQTLRPQGKEIKISTDLNGQDMESVAWLDNQLLAIGLEGPEQNRKSDKILVFRLGESATIETTLTLPWSLWDIKAPKNKGIEALCYDQGWLLAGGEPVIEIKDRRAAPLALMPLKTPTDNQPLTTGEWSPYLLWLSTGTGKISAFDCKLEESGKILKIWAIERHYEVARILYFTITLGSDNTEPIKPVVIADLNRDKKSLPNMEGLVVLSDNNFVIISDNQASGIQGKTEGIVVTAAPQAPPITLR